jgi:hypothetical protein
MLVRTDKVVHLDGMRNWSLYSKEEDGATKRRATTTRRKPPTPPRSQRAAKQLRENVPWRVKVLCNRNALQDLFQHDDDDAAECSLILPRTDKSGALYLGGSTVAKSLSKLEQREIKSIVNATLHDEVANWFHERNDDERFPVLIKTPCIRYFRIPIDDDSSVDLREFLDNAIRWMHQELLLHGNLLVHCEKGKSRSASIVIGYLMQYFDLTFDQVSRQSPCVCVCVCVCVCGKEDIQKKKMMKEVSLGNFLVC